MISSSERHQCHQNSCRRKPYFKVKNAPNLSAGALPHTTLGELTLSDPLAELRGPTYKERGRRWEMGKVRKVRTEVRQKGEEKDKFY